MTVAQLDIRLCNRSTVGLLCETYIFNTDNVCTVYSDVENNVARSSYKHYIHVLCMQGLLRVLNMDSKSTHGRALKPSQDKEDRQRYRNEQERSNGVFMSCIVLTQIGEMLNSRYA